jgi:hypothetical protein
VPCTTIVHAASASQGELEMPVTLGAAYGKGTVAGGPEPATATRSTTRPMPGPGGAAHVKLPRPWASVMVTWPQGCPPMVTVMVGDG